MTAVVRAALVQKNAAFRKQIPRLEEKKESNSSCNPASLKACPRHFSAEGTPAAPESMPSRHCLDNVGRECLHLVQNLTHKLLHSLSFGGVIRTVMAQAAIRTINGASNGHAYCPPAAFIASW